MATVTGLTAARMLDIEANSIVDGTVDPAGNLILTTYNGVDINAGNVAGPPGADGSSMLIPEKLSSAAPSTYPTGVSQFAYTTQGGWPTAYGTVFTFIVSITRGFQIVSEKETNKIWFRNVGQDDWTAFYQIATTSQVEDYVNSRISLVTDTFSVDPEPDTIVRRDENGRLQSADEPLLGTDVVNLNYLGAYVASQALSEELGGGVNLNDITTPGVYTQSQSAEAGSGSNYPRGIAGVLEVFNNGSNMIWQRYTSYAEATPEIWARGFYTPSWSVWERYSPVRVATGSYSSSTDLAANSGVSIPVTFPAGRFTSIPRVVLNATISSRIITAATLITTSGFTARLDNFTTGAATDRDRD